ncbi:hypothetical protein M3084_06500 [Succinatimonas hippei]|uniref:hypothetical protein n=1 Tax=Succinatimonas hippei TaxID=626938 RepID=UPI0020116A94|nr:hypothetical protein [Succinatimonas hippei]MCL1603500.1 hypothetical protein [Succinatimonas hippei]
MKVDSVLTFGLEPLLGIPGGRNDRTRNMYQYIYPDLTIFSNYPRIYNFFGQLDLADSLGACLLFKKCSAAVFNIQNATHNVPKILYFKSQLVDLFDSFIANDTLLTKKFKQTFCFEDESFVKLLWLINRPLYDNKLQEVKRILVNNLETTMKYELLEFIYAKILYKTNLFEESKEIFFDLIRKINDYYEFYLYMSSICFKLFLKNRMLVNLFEDAKKYAITALELDPEKSAVHVNLSKIYESENDLDKAILHMTWACKLHTETLYDSYVSRLKVLLKKARKPFIPFNKESLIQDKRVNLKHVDALFRK